MFMLNRKLCLKSQTVTKIAHEHHLNLDNKLVFETNLPTSTTLHHTCNYNLSNPELSLVKLLLIILIFATSHKSLIKRFTKARYCDFSENFCVLFCTK